MKIRKIKTMGFLGIVLLIILSYFPNSSSIVAFEVSKTITESYIIKDLITTSEIIITNDTDFDTHPLNFPGTGTAGDPYLIENYKITGVPIGIHIEPGGGVGPFNVSFIIRNCWIEADFVCIKIVDANNSQVTIDNCDCVNTNGGDGIGIYLINCDGATVINCRCNNNFHMGMKFELSTGLWIEDNTCDQNDDEGIFIDNASDSGLFLNNTCMNGATGIRSDFSASNTFRYNNCTNNSYTGYGLYYSDWLVIENNTAYLNGAYGFQILSSDHGTLIFNNILNTTSYGVYAESGVDFFTIHHNNFIGNNIGGSSQALDHEVTAPPPKVTWYDTATNEGNYWNDYVGSGNYDIDGTALNFDPYPLNSPIAIIIPEYSYVIWGLTLLSVIGLVTIFLKKR